MNQLFVVIIALAGGALLISAMEFVGFLPAHTVAAIVSAVMLFVLITGVWSAIADRQNRKAPERVLAQDEMPPQGITSTYGPQRIKRAIVSRLKKAPLRSVQLLRFIKFYPYCRIALKAEPRHAAILASHLARG